MTEENSEPVVEDQSSEPVVGAGVDPSIEPEAPVSESVPGAAPETISEISAETIINESVQPVEPIPPSPVPEPIRSSEHKSEPFSQPTPKEMSAEPVVVTPGATTIVEKFVYQPTLEMMRALQRKSLASIQNRKRKKIQKIMTLFTKKQKITTTDIQVLLIVSRNTAVRYADVLEKEGRIKQVGERGPSVYYIKS